VLEATVICLDNSEWMRNGDYVPTRLEAQQDAANLICAAKTQQNAESTVAVMTMAQSKNRARAEVLVSLTPDLGKILSSVHSVKIGGEGNFSAAMQVAQLVLKHRQNKNQHQRIIAFVGSPIEETNDDLVKLAKKLKKNNVAVDIVNFGEETQNVDKLEAFVAAVNNPSEESHLQNVPPGPHILSDILLSSPIVVGEGGGGGFGAAAAASAAAAAVAASSGGGEYDFGVDPTLDPELALALRLSMEEERARQQAAAQASSQPEAQKQEGGAAPAAAPPQAAPSADVEMEDFDDDLKAAMQLSIGGGAAGAQQQGEGATPMELSEDEQIQMALQMSMAAEQAAASADASNLQDQDFLNSVLSSLPGVDPNDERIRGVLNSLTSEKKEDKKDDKK